MGPGEVHLERITDDREGGRLHGHTDEAPITDGVVLLNLGGADFFLDTAGERLAPAAVRRRGLTAGQRPRVASACARLS